jgi:LmbE family N-acetylglucosaminyl deacetylase
MRYTVISPHFDDAVLSLGGLLVSVGRQATVVTVCAGAPRSSMSASTWDAQSGFLDGAEAAIARQKEDVAACGMLDVDRVHLPYLDAPYRTSPSDLDGLFAALCGVVKPPALVFAPAGIGDHVDHVTVRDLVLEAALTTRAEVRLYADLPYAARLDGWTAGGPNGSGDRGPLGSVPAPTLAAWRLADPADDWITEQSWRRKRDALFAYASQLTPLAATYGHIAASDGPLRRELTWRAEPIAPVSKRAAVAADDG